MRVVIRRIRADEGPLLMQARLTALLDAPWAFAGTYTDAIQRPAELWAERARDSASGSSNASFVAMADDGPVGLAGAFTPVDRPRSRQIVSVWVEPALRGQGLGSRLVEAVMDWARLVGAETAELWVAQPNGPARALYESLGFTDTGERWPMASDPSVVEERLERPLRD